MTYTPDSRLVTYAYAPSGLAGAVWRRVKAAHSRAVTKYTEEDVCGIVVPAYVETCEAVRLDVVLVLAQVMHEADCLASWWAARPRRNPSGIGVSGLRVPGLPSKAPAGPWAWNGYLWARGYSFARWAPDAVETHCGLLLRYAVAPGAETPAQAALINRAIVKAPRRVWGVAPTLRGLGGSWAWPGVGYAAKVAAHANALMGEVR